MTSSMHSFTIPAIPGAAIACDLTDASDTPEERFAEYGRLFAQALIARDRAGTAVVFTFAAKPGVGEWITDLARREAACCPFLTHEVDDRSNEIVWTTSTEAGPPAEAYLDELCALPERLDEGFTGLVSRLAERDVHVVADGPSRLVIAEGASNPSGGGATCC